MLLLPVTTSPFQFPGLMALRPFFFSIHFNNPHLLPALTFRRAGRYRLVCDIFFNADSREAQGSSRLFLWQGKMAETECSLQDPHLPVVPVCQIFRENLSGYCISPILVPHSPRFNSTLPIGYCLLCPQHLVLLKILQPHE